MRSILSLGILIVFFFVSVSCEEPREQPQAEEIETATETIVRLATQLVQVKQSVTPTAALATYPDMDRDMAYKVQLEALGAETKDGDHLVGWKMGGTRVVDQSVPPDPSFAYILHSDSLPDAASVSSAKFVEGDLLVEAEIAFVMGKDLQGDTHSMEAVADAVAEVAGAIELIDIRIVPGEDGIAPAMNHMIAANLSHAGVILTKQRSKLEGFNLVDEEAKVLVDGVEKASGKGGQIMGTTPMDALYWIANALPGQGKYLRAGDVVITGGLYENPTLVAGSTAEVQFDSFGSITVSMKE